MLAWIGLIVAVALIVLGFSMSAVNIAQMERVIDRGLKMRGENMARGMRPFQGGRFGGGGGPNGPPNGAPRSSGDLLVDIQRPVVMGADGTLLQGPLLDPSAITKDHRAIVGFSRAKFQGEEIRVYTTNLMRPLDGPQEGPNPDPSRPMEINGVVQVASDVRSITQLKEIQLKTLLSTVPLAIIGALIAAFFLAARVVKPVSELGVATQSLAEGDYAARLPAQELEEFAVLETQFNQMAERVQQSVSGLQTALDQQRRFTADASHELRTPLTRMQLATSSALSGDDQNLREALVVADTAAKDMGALVQQLLDLAKADTGEMTSKMVPLDLRVIVAEAVDKLGFSAVPIELRLDDKAVNVLGDAGQLERVIFNLVENAQRHTDSGHILVELYGNGNAKLQITDTGAGIAPEHLPHLTERFYRVDSSRDREHGGTGLGLAIVSEIVRAHGGHMRIESELGLGTMVAVALPLK